MQRDVPHVQRVQLLDHGYLQYIEHWGSDERIVESARMSTDGAFRGWGNEDAPGDEKLLAFLMNHHHDSPFEFAGMTIEVQAPIAVFREWHRHRTQSYNEMSARYTPLPNMAYMPTAERCLIVNAKNKQAGKAKGAGELTHARVLGWLDQLADLHVYAEKVYQCGLAIGIPKELARLAVTVGRYSRMRATANLRNWLAFLTLREAPDAQWEIRQYAHAVAAVIAERFPRTYQLYCERRDRVPQLPAEAVAAMVAVDGVRQLIDINDTNEPLPGTLAADVLQWALGRD